MNDPTAVAPLTPCANLHLELERALARLHRATLVVVQRAQPIHAFEALKDACERAFHGMLDAYDARTDRRSGIDRASAAVGQFLSAVHLAAERDERVTPAIEELTQCAEHLTAASSHLGKGPDGLSRRVGLPAVQASHDVPNLHDVQRQTIVPVLVFPTRTAPEIVAGKQPPIPKPSSFAELPNAIAELKRRAEVARTRASMLRSMSDRPKLQALESPDVPPGFVGPIAPALDDVGFVRARTRDHFEEVAMVGMQREPQAGESWRGVAPLENRMLAAIDAIAAMGPDAVSYIPTLVADAPVKDARIAFAAAMSLGCIRGRDVLAAAEHVLLANEGDAAFVRAFGDGLALAPNELVAAAARLWLEHGGPATRAMSLELMARRGVASADDLEKALADVPAVAAVALVALAERFPERARGILRNGWSGSDPASFGAYLAASALAGTHDLSGLMRAELEGTHAAQAALYLAIAGDEADALFLLRRATSRAAPAVVAALGWAGVGSSVELLVDLLHHEDGEVQCAAAEALDRLTGAELNQLVPLADDDIDVGDPRDPPPTPAPDTILVPSRDESHWRAYWQAHISDFAPTMRYRRGIPFSPVVTLGELDMRRCSVHERRILLRELVIRTGHTAGFDVQDLVAVQDAGIARMKPVAERAASQPGAWVRPFRE